jgi:hypothetical protein
MRHPVAISGAFVLSLTFVATPVAMAAPGAADPVTPIASGDPGPPAVAPARAGADAVTLGHIAPNGYSGVCGGSNGVLVQSASAPTTNSYTVPGAGVITAASYYATPEVTGSLRVLFVKPGAGANQWDIVERTPLLAQTPSSVNTWPLRIPVPAETRLGLFMPASNVACNIPGSLPGDTWSVSSGKDPLASTVTLGAPTGPFRLNLSAVWEPDVDGDGYGDVSQDLCPQKASLQTACPAPDVTITKQPKRRSTKRKAKIKFTSTEAGSTFTCQVDGKRAKPCTSPFKKKYKYGKHTVVITATSALGIVDATPAIVKFKVKKPD